MVFLQFLVYSSINFSMNTYRTDKFEHTIDTVVLFRVFWCIDWYSTTNTSLEIDPQTWGIRWFFDFFRIDGSCQIKLSLDQNVARVFHVISRGPRHPYANVTKHVENFRFRPSSPSTFHPNPTIFRSYLNIKSSFRSYPTDVVPWLSTFV